MSNGEQSYNLHQIRQLLNTVFDDPQLDALCLDYFPTVYDQFSSGMGKNQKITRLLDHCRRDVTRLETLFTLIQAENEEAFTRFESSLTSKVKDLLLQLMEEPGHLNALFSELSEWKVIHNDLQNLLSEFNHLYHSLTSYHFSRDQHSLNQALFIWKASCVSKLKLIPYKWSQEYASSPELSYLQEKTTEIDDLTQQLMSIKESDFTSLYVEFLELKGLLWDILHAADQQIMILIEKIRVLRIDQ